jgi:hypothetical protein
MGLSFNEEIQSGYYQNTSVSVEGASRMGRCPRKATHALLWEMVGRFKARGGCDHEEYEE